MKKLPLLIVLAAAMQQSITAYAANWRGYSIEGGTRSAGIVFDQYNDFFPGFWGFGAHKFYNEDGTGRNDAVAAHVGMGSYDFNVTVGLSYSGGANGSNVAIPVSIGGGFALDKAKHFAIGPYATIWSSEKSTKSEIGLRLTYSPSALRNR